MDLLLCWLIAPAIMLAVTVGLSLLIERLAGFSVPWGLRPALGIAAVIVIAQFGTTSSVTAKLTMPAIVLCAVLGLVLGRRLAAPRPGRAELVVGALVFGLFATPFLVAGEATWSGYLKLDDAATWMAITEHSFEHGRGIGSLLPSTHEIVLSQYLGKGYPIGGFVPAEALSFFSGEDIAFTLQPAMAFTAAALGLVLFQLVRRALRSDPAAALIAILASLSAILLGYYLWGANKELAAAGLIALGPALAGPAMRGGWPLRAYVAFGVTIGALFAILGPGAIVWVLPTLIPVLFALARDRGRELAVELGGRVGMLTLALAIPVLVTPEGLFNPLDPVLTESSEVSNLNGALNPLQAAGLWPAIDFRDQPHAEPLVLVLAAACLLVAVFAIVACARLPDREGVPFAAYAGGGAVGAGVIVALGSPWVDGKAFATISPALLAAALTGLILLARRRGLRVPALAAAGVVAAVVAWSAFLAYQGAWLAPRAQYAELDQIGERFAGQGPALDTDASFYGVRHFLSDLDPESTTDFRPRTIVLFDDSLLGSNSGFLDIDEIRRDQLRPYNLLVLPRSPATSRPTGAFELAYLGDYYEVWRRTADPPQPTDTLVLGGHFDAGATPECGRVQRLARAAGPGGELVAARVTDPITVQLASGRKPASWTSPTDYAIDANGSGTLTVGVDTAADTYDVLLGGDIYGRAEVGIDGREVGSERGGLYATGDYKRIGAIELDAGPHELELDYEGASLHPGSAEPAHPIGPLLLAPAAAGDLGTLTLPSADYRRLCDSRWDWIEAYEG